MSLIPLHEYGEKVSHYKPLKPEKILKKVVGQQYTFAESRKDLDLLQSIVEGNYANTKPGDPSFHAYAAALNAATEFGAQALDVPELVLFNNLLADLQDEYMPSYPPLSPVTTSLFAAWMVLDAKDVMTGMTLGEMLARHLETQNKLACLQKALASLNASYCAFYEVVGVGCGEVELWDIAEKREFRCWNSSGYAGRKGEVWYVRLLPPFLACGDLSVTLNTPYVFREGGRRPWEDFFERYLGAVGGPNPTLHDYLKSGKSLGYWLEFVFQAYFNHTGNAIFVAGVPDQPGSMPHSERGRKL